MNNEQKAQQYQQMMYQFDLISNKINQIKGLNFELTEQQSIEIKKLQVEQNRIMNSVKRLMDM
jgi:predicted acetyltransferase